MTKPQEGRLVLLAQSGARDALETLLRNIQPDLHRYICGLAGRSSADDVLQDAFLLICRNLKWLRDPALFRPWAYRIASRSAFALLKRERRWSNPESEIPDIEELPAPPDPGPALFSDLTEILDRTSPASRAVLLLHYVHELSIEEAAAILDISPGTAKSRLAYGLSCLRKSMERKK